MSDDVRKGKAILPLASYLLVTFGGAPAAQAVQSHGGAEGLVSHQVGHILFIAGMTFLLFRIIRIRTAGPGWMEFKGFLWLILLWNLLTFIGHGMQEFVGPEKYLTIDDRTVGYLLEGPLDILFYLTQLDHLLLVPSFLMLLAALRTWRAQP